MTRKTDDEIRKQISQLEAQYSDSDFEGMGINENMRLALRWVLGEVEGSLHYERREENKK